MQGYVHVYNNIDVMKSYAKPAIIGHRLAKAKDSLRSKTSQAFFPEARAATLQ